MRIFQKTVLAIGIPVVAYTAAAVPGYPQGPLRSQGGRDTFEPRPQGSMTGEIERVDPASLMCAPLISFEDIPGGPEPGSSLDGVIESMGTPFAERFSGQTLTYFTDYDVLSETAASPLQLQPGEPNHNLNAYWHDTDYRLILTGLGPKDFPDYDAIGEGSVAMLFDFDQAYVRFDVLGGEMGDAFIRFYRRDGSLIDAYVQQMELPFTTYAYRRVGGIEDIAGISIHNDDPAGIAFDNVCLQYGGVAGSPPVCDAGGPYSDCAGMPITIDGTGSYDPDGDIVGYGWDFGDNKTATGPVVTHAYGCGGEYTVILCVTDDDGNQICCTTTATINGASATDSKSWSQIKRRLLR